MSEIELSTRLALIQQRLDQIQATSDETNALLTGDGRPEDGLIVKVDRIEQRAGAAQWFIGILFVAIVGVAVKAFWETFTK